MREFFILMYRVAGLKELLRMLDAMRERGVNVNHVNASGTSALHEAAFRVRQAPLLVVTELLRAPSPQSAGCWSVGPT